MSTEVETKDDRNNGPERVRAPHSSVVIARLLGSEGFSDHTASVVEKYWKHVVMNVRGEERAQRTENAFGEFTATLSDSQRIILGKWIGLHKKMSFDTGLRIGLTAFLHGARGTLTPEAKGREESREVAALKKHVGTLTAQLAEANQRAERAEQAEKQGKRELELVRHTLFMGGRELGLGMDADKPWNGLLEVYAVEIKKLRAALSAGVLPEGAIVHVIDGDREVREGDAFVDLLGEIRYADHGASGSKWIGLPRKIIKRWHPPKAASEEPNWEAEFRKRFQSIGRGDVIALVREGKPTRQATPEDVEVFIRAHVLPSAPPAASEERDWEAALEKEFFPEDHSHIRSFIREHVIPFIPSTAPPAAEVGGEAK